MLARPASATATRGSSRRPPEQGTLMYPGTAGATNWGGLAVDPQRGILYVNAMRVVQLIKLIPREEYERIAGESGAEQGYYPQEGSPLRLPPHRLEQLGRDSLLGAPVRHLLGHRPRDGRALVRGPLRHGAVLGLLRPARLGHADPRRPGRDRRRRRLHRSLDGRARARARRPPPARRSGRTA